MASRWAIVTWKPARWCARATTPGSRWRERPPLARPLTDRHGHGHRPDHRRARPTRAGAAQAASDAPDPPFRREGSRSVRLGQDRRLLSSLHRPGGGGGRLALRTARRRLRDFRLPRARAGAGAGRAGERGHGRAIRQGDGLLEGEGWLDAPVRRRAAVHGRSRDRRRPHPARRRPRFRDPLQGRRPGLHLLLRRGSGQHRRLPRDVEHGLRLQAAGDLFVREQPLRHGHGVRARGGRHRRRGARLQLRHGGGAGERHGRARGIRGDPARRRARAQGRPPDPARGSDLPFHGPLDVRPVARRVPHQRRSRGAAQARPDLPTRREAQGGGRAGSGGAGRPRCRGARGDRGSCGLRRSEPRSRSRRAHVPRVGRVMATLAYRDALNQALREEMQRDPDVFLMGEEVGVYQGAYKVSRGLLEEFGPKRIVDTPIAELGFAGIGVGAAMAGLRPVIEFMTWNFAVLALDQIVNSAAKILYESAGQIPIPIVFRGPNGAALQLAAQHSQAWDSWLAHIPGLKVVAPATPADAKGLLKSAIRDNNPVIVLEGEMLYNLKGEVPEGEHLVPIGRADVKRPGRDVTFICHSKTVAMALKAAEQLAEREGASAEVLDLRSLRPLDEEAIVGSVAHTNRAVVIEEGWPHAGIGAQVVDIIQREAFDQLDAPVLRVTQADVPMPYNKQLERLAKPSADRVVAAARRVLYLD